MDLPLVETIEQMRLATYPPLEIASRHGMIVGASHGQSGRANSALVIDPSASQTAETIEWASQWLSDRGVDPLFRITPLTSPSIISNLTDDRSFNSPTNQTDTMHRRLSIDSGQSRASATRTPTVVVLPDKPPDWITERSADGATEVEALMAKVDGNVCWAIVRNGTSAVAVGRGVVSEGWLSIQAMLTAPGSRGQGLAAAILNQLHRWGLDQGATDSFLDVLSTNTAAKPLYQRFGYQLMYQYHYVGTAKTSSSC